MKAEAPFVLRYSQIGVGMFESERILYSGIYGDIDIDFGDYDDVDSYGSDYDEDIDELFDDFFEDDDTMDAEE